MSLTKVSYSMITAAPFNAADYGARGDGTGALVGNVVVGASWNVWPSWINGSTYGTKPGQDYGDAAWLAANPPFKPTDTWDFVGIQSAIWAAQSAGGGMVYLNGTNYVVSRPIRFVMGTDGVGVNLVGSHFEKCIIRPLTTLDPINSLGTNIGSGVLYFYRVGLSGCTISNVGITTYPLNGGTPSVNTDSIDVGENWLSNGTYHACVLFNNTDSVQLDSVFMSGYGESAITAFAISSISLNNIITEYQTIGVNLQSNSNAYITNSIIFSSSGTGINAWKTSGICLNSSQAYVYGGQITFMRGWSLFSVGTENSFTMDSVISYTDNYGGIFYCLGLIKWRISDCNFTYGIPNDTPIILLDNQNTGTDVLNPNFEGGQFESNNIVNVGGTSTLDTMRVNGTGIQISDNYFGANANGSLTSGYVINSLFNGSYAGAGTVNCIFTNNQLKHFSMNQVSLFGTKINNIDTVGNSTLVGSGYFNFSPIAAGAEATTTFTVTGASLGDIVTGVSFQVDIQRLTINAYVSAADTVTMVVYNGTGSPVDLPNELWTILVQRKNCL